MPHFKSISEEETIRIATDFARTLNRGDIIAFYGDLGAGKSVFCRSIIRTLVGDPKLIVPSPTFSLLQTYDTSKGEVWHFDLYRLEDPDEIYELGWEEGLLERITLIEWPEKLGPLLSHRIKKVEISEDSDNVRIIRIIAEEDV